MRISALAIAADLTGDIIGASQIAEIALVVSPRCHQNEAVSKRFDALLKK
jgi:hypothetical protein